MKKTKKILSLLLTIRMLFACTLVPSAMATDSVIEESIDELVEALVIDEGESPEELTPLMARGCLNGTISDPRWLNWRKWQYTWRSANGVRVIIHFNYDGEYWFDDFKFKD